MIGKRLRSENTYRRLIISVAEPLHFYRFITKFIKSGSKYSIRSPGELISC
jgi:hypothetical protein